jgi:hypothetical protein
MKKFLVNGAKNVGRFVKRNSAKLAVGTVLTVGAMSAQAQTADVADIVSGASTTFTAVAGVCVTMGVFFIGYKIARRIR